MVERCDDPKCKGFGKQFVDRGYGYPVCPANRWNLYPKSMDEKYKGQYVKIDGTVEVENLEKEVVKTWH